MFEQSLLESAASVPSHRKLTTSIALLAQLALLSIAVLMPIFFAQNLALLKPVAVMPIPIPRYTPPPEPVVRESNVATLAPATPALVVRNAFPQAHFASAERSSNTDALTLPSGGVGVPNYNLPISTLGPTTQIQGPTGPLVRSRLTEGSIIRKVKPEYPYVAKITHVEGVVLLEAVISRTGAIEQLRVISGHPMLVPAARDAVAQWQFRPYILNGAPVEVMTQITVDFKLSQAQ